MLVGTGTACMQRGSHAADAKLKQFIFEKIGKNLALSVVPQMAADLNSGQASSAGVASALESLESGILCGTKKNLMFLQTYAKTTGTS